MVALNEIGRNFVRDFVLVCSDSDTVCFEQRRNDGFVIGCDLATLRLSVSETISVFLFLRNRERTTIGQTAGGRKLEKHFGSENF